MSTRAYLVKGTKTSNLHSFNLWHEDDFIEYLADNLPDFYDAIEIQQCAESLKIPISILKLAINSVPLSDFAKRRIRYDIAWGERHHRKNLRYVCG